MSAGHSDFTLYRRLFAQARPYWLHLGALLGLGLITTPVALLIPVPLKIVVDSVLGGHPLPGFLAHWFPTAPSSPTAGVAIAIGILMAITVLAQVQSVLNTWLRAYIGEHLVLGFRARLLEHGQRLSLSYHDTTGTADTVYRIQHDAPALQYLAVDGLIPFVTATITLVAMIVVTARLDWQLALVALAVAPIMFLLSGMFRRRMRRQARTVKKLESSALQVVQEILSALRVVKAFGQEPRETERFVGRGTEGLRARLALALVEGRFGLLVGLTTAGGTAAVLYLGVGHVRAGMLTLGELLMAMSYLAQLYAPLTTISRKAAGLQSYLASAERAFTMLDEVSDVPERPAAQAISRARGVVEFRHVSFGYDDERRILHDVSFVAAPGTRVAVMGVTGAGKSTLVHLLTRFYDPTTGLVLLDGMDLRDYRVADLRRQFAVVLQHPMLFSTSIGENIAYGRPGAPQRDIIAAAVAAHAHDFITNLPRGYETSVGELGQKLSGGERQRIALARAFLRDAPVLILDEPTSSVDATTEGAILEALERLMRGRTVFLVTHRPRTWTMCDLWLQLERGRLVHRDKPLTAALAADAAAPGIGDWKR